MSSIDTVIVMDLKSWIRENFEPSDIWDMDEYDHTIIREFVQESNEREYDRHNDR